MKREPWAIANIFAYAIRVLNSIFCTNREDEKEYDDDNLWLVAEQIKSMCSDMMIDDAKDMLNMVLEIPNKRLCEKVKCFYHHPFVATSEDKCQKCIYNHKTDISDIEKINNFCNKFLDK